MAWHATLDNLDNNSVNLTYQSDDGRMVTQVYPFGNFGSRQELLSKITIDIAELNQMDNRKIIITNALSAFIGTQII